MYKSIKIYTRTRCKVSVYRTTGPLVWLDFCLMALQHFLGHFRHRQLTKPHCSWASFLGSLPVLSALSFASNWQLLFLNQRKRENGRRNVFMTKSPRKNVPDVVIELRAACMPSEHASNRATAPSQESRTLPPHYRRSRTDRFCSLSENPSIMFLKSDMYFRCSCGYWYGQYGVHH